MALTSVTIAGFEIWPSKIDYRPMRIGGSIRRSLDGTAYAKDVAKKHRLALPFDFATADEMQAIRVVFEQCRMSYVAITCSSPYISSNFLLKDEELAFEPLDGPGNLYAGTLTFEER